MSYVDKKLITGESYFPESDEHHLLLQIHRITMVGKDLQSHRVQPLPNTTMATKPCNEVLYLPIVLSNSRDGDSTTSLESLFQCLITLLVNFFFLITNLNFPGAIEAISPCLLLVAWETRPTAQPHFIQLKLEVSYTAK